MKKLVLSLTKSQVYKIREFVANNGYPEGCGLRGKHFYLITQPVIKVFDTGLDVILLTEKQGKILCRVFKKMELIED